VELKKHTTIVLDPLVLKNVKILLVQIHCQERNGSVKEKEVFVKIIIMAVKHKDLKKVVKELKGAVKAHGRQANTIEQHIKDMNAPYKMMGSTLYGNPLTKKKSDPCWDNFEMIGMKNKGGKKVPNCVPMKKKGYGHKKK
jgi:hypothetical protein